MNKRVAATPHMAPILDLRRSRLGPADLMRRTLTVTHGRIDRARDVAERAARTLQAPIPWKP